jgi:hypothetical protein
MIALNACGGKGFACVENAAAAQSLRSALQLGITRSLNIS